MSAAPWTKERLVAWIQSAGVTVNDAKGYMAFLEAVTEEYYRSCINTGLIPSFSDYLEDIREAVKILKSL